MELLVAFEPVFASAIRQEVSPVAATSWNAERVAALRQAVTGDSESREKPLWL
jgi:hypothetical protein